MGGAPDKHKDPRAAPLLEGTEEVPLADHIPGMNGASPTTDSFAQETINRKFVA